jgi:hyperosmotically inducible protein
MHLGFSMRQALRPRAFFTATLLTAALFAVPSFSLGFTQNNDAQTTTAADNSRQNKAAGSTADQQSNHRSDVTITREIRKSIIADKSLSTYAHNVKIITRHGMVTLKGPVKSNDEKQAVASKAEAIVGSSDMVKDELTVENSNN